MVLQLVTGGALGGVILPSMIIHFSLAVLLAFSATHWRTQRRDSWRLAEWFRFTPLAGLTYTSFGGLNPVGQAHPLAIPILQRWKHPVLPWQLAQIIAERSRINVGAILRPHF